MSAQHTPGPWEIKKMASYIRIRKSSSFKIRKIAQVSFSKAYGCSAEDMANAHLIAASTKLLEACKVFLDPDFLIEKKVLLAKQAIAKAEGQG